MAAALPVVGNAANATRLGRSLAKAVDNAHDASRAAKAGRVSKDALKAARKEFSTIKPKFWQNEAANNASKYSPENLTRMRQGKAPIGVDGHPMELHHRTPLAEGRTNAFDNLQPLTRTGHRLGPNYKANHPNLP